MSEKEIEKVGFCTKVTMGSNFMDGHGRKETSLTKVKKPANLMG